MKDCWQEVIAAWNLAQAGRWDEALANSAASAGLAEVIAQRSRQKNGEQLPAVAGWSSYFRADYLDAWTHFSGQEGAGWLRAWAELGMAKVASDCGRWRLALRWCAKAWRTAAAGEHLDLLAEVAGARGEILLRCGRPADAAASFVEDTALLSPGSRYRGRVRCYQAHAWSRMGPAGQRAARLAYRLAAHSTGEASTKSYALAGLALLNVRAGDCGAMSEVMQDRAQGLSEFWIHVACARLAQTPAEARRHQERANAALPSVYHAECWWFDGWVNGHARPELLPPEFVAGTAEPFTPPEVTDWTRVELPVDPDGVNDAPWLEPASWPTSREGWWSIRDAFMP